jgi:hypothetical protein
MRVEPRWRGALRSALLCLVALLTSAAASAQDKRILLLYDEDKTLPAVRPDPGQRLPGLREGEHPQPA